MSRQTEVKLHTLMCFIGGFAGAYSLLRCRDNFGAAQTANLIYALHVLLGGNWQQFLLRLLGLASYMAGILSYVTVSHHTAWNPEKWVLATEGICLLIIGLLPSGISHFVYLYPIFYMLAAQWSVYHGANGYTASTIFSSNNVKQFTLAIGEYCFEKNPAQAEKAKFFGLTLLWYHLGAAAVLLCYQTAGQYSIWLCYLPVTLAAWLVFHTEQQKRAAKPVLSAAKAKIS